MISSFELGKTFFPGSRKEVIVGSPKLLETRAGEKRIQLPMSMPLSDQKLVGMPTWLGDSYDLIAKENSLLQSDKWGHDLEQMTLTIFSTDDTQKSLHIAVAPLLTGFLLRRDPQRDNAEELSDVNLHFVAYIQATSALWRYLFDVHRKSIYIRFETTQKELFDKPADDKQMTLEQPDADDYDEQRRESTSKKHDAEFASA